MTESTTQNERAVVADEAGESGWFTTYTVFARPQGQASPAVEIEKDRASAEVAQLVQTLENQGVTVRGFYDVSGMRADADVMVWLYGRDPSQLQAAIRDIRRTEMFAGTHQVFSAMGADRMAEFNKDHIPAFAMGRKPRKWLCVYPFSRSYDWYLLEPQERARLLRSHGQLGQDFPDIWANTTSSFGLNDWEWMLGLEAPRLDMLVDMMRHLRNNETRLYVREEVPFYTGHYITPEEIAEVLA